MLLLVTAEMLLKMPVHAAKILEQIVKVLEQIVKVKVAGLEAAILAERAVAHLIVLATAIRISEHLVGLGDLAKLLFGARLRALVGMVLEGQLPEGLFTSLSEALFLTPSSL